MNYKMCMSTRHLMSMNKCPIRRETSASCTPSQPATDVLREEVVPVCSQMLLQTGRVNAVVGVVGLKSTRYGF